MTNVSITFDVDALTKELQDSVKRQIPFAMMMTLNRTAEEMQERIRQRIYQRGFTVRSAASARYLSNSIRIRRSDRATKTSPSARVRIEPQGNGGGRAGLLGFLEVGGPRSSQFAVGSGATFGPGSVVVPQRSSPMEMIPRALYPSMTGLQERRAIDGSLSKGSLKGKRRTFAVRTKPGQGLILQRTGKGKRDTRVLFVVKPRVQVEGRQFFFSTAERTARERFEINFAGFMALAIRTAR